VVSVKPRSLNESNEELGAVRVRTCVGHGEKAGLVMLQAHVLVSKLRSIDGEAASAVVVVKVAALSHELGYDSMERRLLVGVALFVVAAADGPEVFGSLWIVVGIQLKLNIADIFAIP